jgi:hypothetical protein
VAVAAHYLDERLSVQKYGYRSIPCGSGDQGVDEARTFSQYLRHRSGAGSGSLNDSSSRFAHTAYDPAANRLEEAFGAKHRVMFVALLHQNGGTLAFWALQVLKLLGVLAGESLERRALLPTVTAAHQTTTDPKVCFFPFTRADRETARLSPCSTSACSSTLCTFPIASSLPGL